MGSYSPHQKRKRVGAVSYTHLDYKAADKGYLTQTLLADEDTTVFVGDESDDIDYTAKTGLSLIHI